MSLKPPNRKEARMLTNWIPPATLSALNEGFVVAIMLEAKEGEGDALAAILHDMTPPTVPSFSLTESPHDRDHQTACRRFHEVR